MFAYQTEAIEWMTVREEDRVTPGGFLCHEMGLGKTRMMCALIDKNPSRTLILTTKSTLEGWAKELRTLSQFRYGVKILDDEFVLNDRPIVVIATHHSVFRHKEWLLQQAFSRLVIDEAHIMRNGGRMFRAFLELGTAVRYRWGITATPFNNSDSDIARYVKFLRPLDNLPATAFKHYFLRKLRSDVIAGGPTLTITKLVYNFESTEEQNLYDYISGRIDDAHDWIARNARIIPWRQRGHMYINLIMRQRQATIHPQLVLNSEKLWAQQIPGGIEVGDWNPKKVTKANKILEMVKKDRRAGKSTMIVTHFKEELQLLKQRLEQENIVPKILEGKTTIKDRRKLELHNAGLGPIHTQLLLDSIQRQKGITLLAQDSLNIIQKFIQAPTVLLLQIQAGGVGISLPWVHHVINAAPDWNPFLEKQSIYRAYRINTTHNVEVTSMYFRDTIDIRIQGRQREKLERGRVWMNDDESSISAFVGMPA